MAITQTNKLGLPLYSAGTDPHPGRVDHNTIMQAINDNAMGVKQGLHASRPGAGVAGRTYFSTDRSTFSYDTGSTWADYVPIGGAAPSGVRAGATGPVLSGAGGNEGTSARLARADHTHALPLATDDLPGLLSADMYYLLARMTDAATPSTVVRRDAAARISVGTPTSGVHAATKAYADLVASNASNLTTGTVAVGRLPLASAESAGVISAAHYSLLDAAGYDAGPRTIVMTDHLGNVKSKAFFANVGEGQTNTAHALTRKDYVDGQFTAAKSYADSLVGTTAAPITHNHSASDTTSGVFAAARLPVATPTSAGAMSTLDKKKLDTSTAYATENSLVMRNSLGQSSIGAPTSGDHIANKGYVDGKKWDGADIISGLINQARIANATSSLNGLMSSTDKAKLDAATTSNTGNTIVMRASNGRTNLGSVALSAAPTTADDATRKDYVDGKKWAGEDITSGYVSMARLRAASDFVNLSPVANTLTTVTVNFPAGRFSETPVVTLQGYNVSSKILVELYPTSVSATQFTFAYQTTDNVARTIYWQAMQKG